AFIVLMTLGNRTHRDPIEGREAPRGEHGVAVLLALALLDAQQHALAFDVGDLEVGDLGHAQAGTISDAERGLVLDTRCRLQKPRHLFLAEHDPQPLRQGYEGEMAAQLGMVEGYLKKNRNAATEPFMVAGGIPSLL